jgi:hypothetical protein
LSKKKEKGPMEKPLSFLTLLEILKTVLPLEKDSRFILLEEIYFTKGNQQFTKKNLANNIKPGGEVTITRVVLIYYSKCPVSSKN